MPPSRPCAKDGGDRVLHIGYPGKQTLRQILEYRRYIWEGSYNKYLWEVRKKLDWVDGEVEL